MSGQAIGRNDPCPCGSGKKHKHCCLRKRHQFQQNDAETIRRSIDIQGFQRETDPVSRPIDREGFRTPNTNSDTHTNTNTDTTFGPSTSPEPTDEEVQAFKQFLENADPEFAEQLIELANRVDSGDEFANLIMVGACPSCESENTQDCEDDPAIDNPCIGRCKDCKQIWCCDCGECFDSGLDASQHECPFWDEEIDDELDDELDGDSSF